MAHYENPRSQNNGEWSPPQTYTEQQIYQDQHEMNVTDHGSPMPSEGYWTSPPAPPEGWTYDAQPPKHDAPEVVQSYPDPSSRPLSPSSQGGSTLYSPRPPHVDLYGKEHYESHTEPVPPAPEERTICGMRKRWFVVVIGILALLLFAGLGVGLGVGLGLKKKSDSSDANDEIDPFCRDSPELCIGGALGSQYYSTKGAFNGSGIALAGEPWSKGQQRIFTLFFQHHTGDIRYMQYETNAKWKGGTKAQTVATDAKNATALSTVAYFINTTQHFHVFYVSKENLIREMVWSNVTNTYSPGPLNNLNLPAYSTPGTLGLQACWKGNFYGDSDASKMPTPGGETNTVNFTPDAKGMNLWIPIDDSTFQQYSWVSDQPDTWFEVSRWEGKNVHAGVGCYSWGPGNTTYTMMSNKANDTEVWWKDTDNITSTAEHPTQSWQNATDSLIEDTYPASSFGYTTYFIAQMEDRSIKGFNISYGAENTTIVSEDTFVVSDPVKPVLGLGGTHLTVTGYAELDDQGEKVWDRLYIFYQTEGNDITAFTREIEGVEWSIAPLEIPDE